MRPLLLIALALSLAAAGCTGGRKDAVSESLAKIAPGPSAEELARTPAVLRGILTSTSLSPIPGAHLAIERLKLNVTTNAAGAFQFLAVPAGEQEIVVTAEKYVTRTLRIQAVNGTMMDFNLTLTPAPSMEPFTEVRELKGFLSCGLVAQTPAGEARRDCAAADPNHRSSFEIGFSDDARGAVYELVWDAAANPGAKTLRLIVETVGYGSLDAELGNATGEGRISVSVPTAQMLKYYPEGGAMRARIVLEGELGAALQTTYTLYVTGFYHGAAPDGYTALQG